MQFRIRGQRMCALLVGFFLLAALPAAAAVKNVERGTAQQSTQAARASQAAQASASQAAQAAQPTSALVRWQPYAGAVRYVARILRKAPDGKMTTVFTKDYIYTTGVYLSLVGYGAAEDLYWTVQPLDYYGKPIASASDPHPLATEESAAKAPVLTTEFDRMPYALLYPVYSWIPLPGQKHHEVEIYRRTGSTDVYVHTLRGGEYDAYDDMAFRTPGHYVFRVRGLTAAGAPASDWSDYRSFDVVDRAPIAAFGDSITHGGGAISLPPSYLLYNWETYCNIPVKNLGHSGDTTGDMLARFDQDVLPFAPRVLIIMGGVNDFRTGIYGAQSVRNLTALRDKCKAYGITPIFLTATPIHPALMTSRLNIAAPPADWWEHRDYINNWIMQQEYSIDVATVISNANGELEEAYTTDGLHPDFVAKRYIGQMVESYLRMYFAYAAGEAARRAPVKAS